MAGEKMQLVAYAVNNAEKNAAEAESRVQSRSNCQRSVPRGMLSMEAIFSLLAMSLIATALLLCRQPAQNNSLYGIELANDFAEVSLKSEVLGPLSKYYSSQGTDLQAQAYLSDFAAKMRPSANICLEISGASADFIGGCRPGFKDSYSTESDLVLNDSVKRIRFTSYFY